MIKIILALIFIPILSYAGEVDFDWDDIKEASSYEILLKNKNTNETKKISLQKSEWKEELDPGLYYFKMRSIDFRGVAGDWSEVQDFVIKHKKVKVFFEEKEGVYNFSWDEEEKLTVKVFSGNKLAKEFKTNKNFSFSPKNEGNYKIEIYKGDGNIAGPPFVKEIKIERKIASLEEKIETKPTKYNVYISGVRQDVHYKGRVSDSTGQNFFVDLNYENYQALLGGVYEFRYVSLRAEASIDFFKVMGNGYQYTNFKLGLEKKYSLGSFYFKPQIFYKKTSRPMVQASFSGFEAVDSVDNNNLEYGLGLGAKINKVDIGLSYNRESSLTNNKIDADSIQLQLMYEFRRFKSGIFLSKEYYYLEKENQDYLEQDSNGVGIKFEINF